MNEAKSSSDRRICMCVGLLFCILSSTFSFSQESKGEIYRYARKIVDTLASPSMHGRGYVKNGDKIAAKYIAEEFKKLGLLSLKKLQTGDPKSLYRNYLQYFTLPINTFPGKMEITFPKNGRYYEDLAPFPMIGFMPDPSSPTIKGKFKVEIIDSTCLGNESDLSALSKRKFRNTFLQIDTIGIKKKEQKKLFTQLILHPPTGVKGLLICTPIHNYKDSLFRIAPWDLSMTQSDFPVIQVEKSKVAYDDLRINIKAKFIPEYETQNVIGYIKGSAYPDSFILYTAHYDHLGEIGENSIIDPFYFPGANDNASGCAMLLNLAKYYSAHPPKYSIAFIAFGAEEAGLVGSKFYTEHPLFPLKQIKFLVNFDIMGTGDEGIKVVNATEFRTEFKTLEKLNAQGSYVKEVSARGKASISDHYFFTEKGVKCFYIYTLGGIKAYHDIYDKAETLPLTKFEDVFHLMTDFTDWLQN